MINNKNMQSEALRQIKGCNNNFSFLCLENCTNWELVAKINFNKQEYKFVIDFFLFTLFSLFFFKVFIYY